MFILILIYFNFYFNFDFHFNLSISYQIQFLITFLKLIRFQPNKLEFDIDFDLTIDHEPRIRT